MNSTEFDVVVIGGGITGLFTTLDLTLRGLKVCLLERNVIGNGTSGKMHGLLHSGARYVFNDVESAIECKQENRIISKIAPHLVEETRGYFVAISERDERNYDEFVKGLKRANINYKEIEREEAIREEPKLTRDVRMVIEVEDKVVFPRDLMASVAVSSYLEGAVVLQFSEVKGFNLEKDHISEVLVEDKVSNSLRKIRAKVFLNTTGPWGGKIAKLAKLNLEVLPAAGVMNVYSRRLTRRVINRLRPPSDGDILVPYEGESIMGTTAVIIEDPDNFQVDEESVNFLTDEGSKMIPELSKTPLIRSYASVRPLIKAEKGAREATRDFKIIEHKEVSNLVSVIGGKFTTGRLAAEKLSDLISKRMGLNKVSKTQDYRLFGSDPYREIRDLSHLEDISQIISSYKGSTDEDRGKPMIFGFALYLINKLSRGVMGW